ncbi:MAG: exosortase family protein XrtF [Weeksellaceae bacterium]|nr:exosortase family protein XrtF [Weeksellaceae bacterium]
MKEYFPVIIFFLRFFGVYILLTWLYSAYLQPYVEVHQIADPFTYWVSNSAAALLNAVGFQAESVQYAQETYTQLVLNGRDTALVNEGCNALSVMIIYLSFIFAFFTTWWKTLAYAIFGIIILHLTNIVRIAIITYIYRFHPEHARMAHDFLFPAIIYGMVVLLWLFWIFYVVKPLKARS